VVGRYRALLIGNSTYPADEHNLQTLKGPVKDIAVLNRALTDPASGLFADVDVTLLPEATSTRAIRALGRFFGTADRDDVLLVYFSGHGKLDQSGRLHLCMQDTESADLLSTAVSSARIKEFADASHARNVVIVLDCCYAGAFRGSDLGEAVAGPGRYVLTSCRGTQLANDATIENGTSFFTQHLVNGLVDAAADQDGDGYVTFSDLYAYVDRRLRAAGKQIPQRRVDGDGDVRLARRTPPPAAEVTTTVQPPWDTATPTRPSRPQEPGPGSPPDGGTAGKGPAVRGAAPAPARSHTAWARPGILLAAAAAIVAAGGVITALVLLTGGSGANSGSNATAGASTGTFVAHGPWRLKIDDRISGHDHGCTVTLTDAHSGQQIRQPGLAGLYGTYMFQIHQAGSFRWQVNNPACIVVPIPGPGRDRLPLAWQQGGDSDAFVAPTEVAVQVKDYNGSPDCRITLNDPTSGQAIDFQTATPGKTNNTVKLNAGGHPTAYLSGLTCAVRVSPAS
jgi:Caspase domain